MKTLAQTTELDAVNIMLNTIGESPVNSLDDGLPVADAAIARSVLREVTIDVQSPGWQFNTERNYKLTPALLTKYITVPGNCLEVTPSGKSATLDITLRGTRIYDRQNHTYEFGSSITVDMVVLLDFAELPQSVRHYITIRASRVFQQRNVGSDVLNGFTEKDETRALVAIRKYDSETGGYNVLTGNYSVMRVLDR
ncbi:MULTISPECIES: tail protein [Pseudomonas]|uniref:Tail tubular protein A n=1 Tax=Pseudomonas juntendi TaxID=2666183 RepID=A0ABD4YBT5_9PSED|nr:MULTISPECIES: tail protein [Pseudomonas]EGB99539.1 tail protein [Pseudomonas sp. TJI-51]MBA6121633.1 hypothetical protein [Pseudomonas juntendi]MBR7523090.1 hypothetical protein [Pseudomonas juntendi]MCF3155418.1 hypothetical protein [Pseudomonas juntendi]MCI0911118.1 hypothetical protein [Pseudomonas putida]